MAMKPWDNIRKIFFIGIGGIGMSALARYFHAQGIQIFGYDKTETDLTRQLVREGMQICYEDDVRLIPDGIDLVVYTPAIPLTHSQLTYFLQNNYPVKKRAEILEIVTADQFTIAVSGSHGKTTVTTMIAHILIQSGINCVAFTGGISRNYQTNYLDSNLHRPKNTLLFNRDTLCNKKIFIVEADEFDKSFHRLAPDIAIITAVDTDHLDVYGNLEQIESAFLEFTRKLKPKGKIIVHENVSFADQIHGDVFTYGVKEAFFKIENIRQQHQATQFDISISGQLRDVFSDEVSVAAYADMSYHVELPLPGRHNVENAAAAIAVAWLLGIDSQYVKAAMATFKGIKRRFEFVCKNDDFVFIDDYAHHPVEIKRFLEAVREWFPEKNITVVFQPHLFSRTRDLYQEFAEALSLANEVILLDIYPAREKPIEGVSSQLIYDKITLRNKTLLNKDALIAHMQSKKRPEVLCTVGAGDIDTLIEPIRQMYQC